MAAPRENTCCSCQSTLRLRAHTAGHVPRGCCDVTLLVPGPQSTHRPPGLLTAWVSAYITALGLQAKESLLAQAGPSAVPQVLLSCPLSGSLPTCHNPVTRAQVSAPPAQDRCHHAGCPPDAHGTYRAVQVCKHLPGVSPVRRADRQRVRAASNCVFPFADVTDDHELGGLNNTNWVPYSSGGQKSKTGLTG